jgi:hypothetical protein
MTRRSRVPFDHYASLPQSLACQKGDAPVNLPLLDSRRVTLQPTCSRLNFTHPIA